MLIHQASEEKSGNLYEAIALPQVFQSGRIGESVHGRSPGNMFFSTYIYVVFKISSEGTGYRYSIEYKINLWPLQSRSKSVGIY